MMRQVVLISGRICTGKSGLARQLNEQFGFDVLRTSDVLREECLSRKLSQDRRSLQILGDALDAESDHGWVLAAVRQRAERLAVEACIVVDHVRTPKQVECFRSA